MRFDVPQPTCTGAFDTLSRTGVGRSVALLQLHPKIPTPFALSLYSPIILSLSKEGSRVMPLNTVRTEVSKCLAQPAQKPSIPQAERRGKGLVRHFTFSLYIPTPFALRYRSAKPAPNTPHHLNPQGRNHAL